MSLEDIGFYTLSDDRAKCASEKTPVWRAEILVSDKCNFRCPYCRGMADKGDVNPDDLKGILSSLIEMQTQHYRFSGGEPTIYPHIISAIKMVRATAKRVALSTNGSAPRKVYESLITAGIDDFSVSLDACCASTGDKMCGVKGMWDVVTDNIRWLSSHVYTTAGIVYTDENRIEIANTIRLAADLGVHDIRVIPAAQYSTNLDINEVNFNQYPILRYRLNNMKSGRAIRGLSEIDNRRCPLVLDDMAIAGGKHYPCIIYLRERGKAIGRMGPNIRQDRRQWFETHDCFADDVCRNNCLDVCVDYNNRWAELYPVTLPRLESSLFDWQAWRLGAEFTEIFDAPLRWQNLDAIGNRIRELTIGYCPGEAIPCRPKPRHIAIMFRTPHGNGWIHMRIGEFQRVFGQTCH
jgi:MoaA/NifB/PqqE/SkfB family radical SAM enzyme